MSGADTAFVLICPVFVLFMTPGLAFFYGGLGRRKNVVSNILASLFIVGLEIVLWMTVGFSRSFGSDHAGVIGGLDYLFMGGVSSTEAGPYASTIPFC